MFKQLVFNFVLTIALLSGIGPTEVTTIAGHEPPMASMVADHADQNQLGDQEEYQSEILIHNSSRLTIYKGDGYLRVKSEAKGQDFIIQISSVDGLSHYAYVPNTNDFQTVPLPDGHRGKLTLFEHTEGNFYKDIESVEFNFDIKDEFKRYTMPNVFVQYNEQSLAAKTAKELKDNSKSDLDFVIKAYSLVAKMTYDYNKAVNVDKLPLYYIPNVDKILTLKTGICSDKATLLAAMLRSQGIPTKYVTGEERGIAHAWNEVYLDNNWYSIDATAGTFYITSDYKVETCR